MARRMLFVVVLLLALVGGGTVVFRSLFEQPSDEPASHIAAPVVPLKVPAVVPDAAVTQLVDAGPATRGEVKVVDTSGTLEKRTADGEEWARLARGDTIRADEALRTGRNATAVLQVGEGGSVKVGARTELSFKKVSDDVVRLRLEEGRVLAEGDAHGKTLFQVEAKGSDAVAESRAGRFSMISDGRGQVAVATETGEVRFKSQGKEVAVPAGTQSVVVGKSAPAAPTPVPRSLLLKVAPPDRNIQRENEHEVEGTATPGSLVRANGKLAKVDPQGRFKLKVPLDEGQNTVEIVAMDALGREKATQFAITVDSRAPPIKGVMTWGNNPQTQ